MGATNNLDKVYKNIRYHIQNFKFAGLTMSEYPNFANIGIFHSDYEER